MRSPRKTPRERLAEHLTALGYRSIEHYMQGLRERFIDVQPKDIKGAQGRYRHKSEDSYLWTAFVYRPVEGGYVPSPIDCWDSMTLCAQRGIAINEEHDEAHALPSRAAKGKKGKGR